MSNEILDYIIDNSCNLRCMMVKEIARSEQNEAEVNDDVKKMVELIGNFIPIIIATFLYDALSQKNLERVFAERLEDFKAHSQGNEYRIFLYSMILFDLDINEFYHYLAEAIPFIKNKVLRFAILNKLILTSIQNVNNKGILNLISPLIDLIQKEFKFMDTKEKLPKVIELEQIKTKSAKIIDNLDYCD